MSNIISKISSLIGENGTISDNLARNSGRKCLPITSIICVVEGKRSRFQLFSQPLATHIGCKQNNGIGKITFFA